MKVWILSSDSEITSTKKLILEGEKRGFDVLILNPLDLQFQISKRQFSFFLKKKKLKNPDLVLPRFGWKTAEYGLILSKALEGAGVRVVNSSASIELSTHKMNSLIRFASQGFLIPKTKMAYPEMETEHHLLGRKAQVFKLLHGSQGFGVTLAKTGPQAKAQIDLLRSVKSLSLTQEFIRDARGEDVRAFVIGQKIVAVMKRKAPAGDFRSNLHQGGTSKITRLSQIEKKLVLEASESQGLEISGVDFIRSQKGPVLLEANPFPGLEGIERTCEINVSQAIWDYLELGFK